MVESVGDGGVNDPEVESYVGELLEQIGASVPATEVVSPHSQQGARQVSQDATIAYAEIDLAERDSNEFTDAGTTIREIVDDAEAGLPPDTSVELGGDIFVEPAESSSEGVGLVAAVIILLVDAFVGVRNLLPGSGMRWRRAGVRWAQGQIDVWGFWGTVEDMAVVPAGFDRRGVGAHGGSGADVVGARQDRPAKHNKRDIVNAIFYVAARGCQWRALPACYVKHAVMSPASTHS